MLPTFITMCAIKCFYLPVVPKIDSELCNEGGFSEACLLHKQIYQLRMTVECILIFDRCGHKYAAQQYGIALNF